MASALFHLFVLAVFVLGVFVLTGDNCILQGFWSKAHEIQHNQQNLGYYTVTSSEVTCQVDKPETACLNYDVGT